MSGSTWTSTAHSAGLQEREPGRKAPGTVKAASVILYVYVALAAVIGVLALVAMAGSDTTGSEDRQLAVAGVVSLVMGAIMGLLAYKLRHGRLWALITVLVLLWVNAIQAMFRDAVGFLNVGVAILVTLLLLAPRRSREHFGIG